MRSRAKVPIVALLVIILTLSWSHSLYAEELDLKAEAYVLMDADSGKILVNKNDNKPLPPASMTKLMTLMLAAEALQNGKVSLKEKVTTSDYAASMGGSQIYLEPREVMTFEEMLIAIAVGSANDACIAVAEHLEGSNQRFVELMNLKAKNLGLENTNFVNANGLPDPNHRISAYDMAVIACEAVKNPKVIEYSSIKEYNLRDGKFKLYNTNKLLWWYEGADGLKTGWTEEAGLCLVSTAKRDGLRLIAVVMGANDQNGHMRESMKLFNYGFAKYSYVSFINKDAVCGKTKVGKGIVDYVDAIASDNVGTICLKGEEKQITHVQTLYQYVEAPIVAGQKIGEIEVFNQGELQKTVDLVAGHDVTSGGWLRGIMKMFAETFLIK